MKREHRFDEFAHAPAVAGGPMAAGA